MMSGKRVCFMQGNEAVVEGAIAAGMLEKVAGRLRARDIAVEAEPEALDALAQQGYDPDYGARPLRRKLRQTVEDPLAEMLLSGALQPGDRAKVVLRDGAIQVEKVDGEGEE